MFDWLLLQEGVIIYGALFGLLLSGTIGFPPEDLTLILAGVLVHQAKVSWQWAFLVCYLGILAGDIAIYCMGRYCSKTKLISKFMRSLNQRKVKRMQLQLEKRSIIMIFVSRHLIYLRTVTFFTCGVVKMRFVKFLAADAVAALISVPLMMWLGWLASEHWRELLEAVSRIKYTLFTFAALLISFFVWRYFKYKDSKDTEEELS